MVMGNVPSDVSNNNDTCNITNNFVHLEDTVKDNCFVPNWDSAPGRGSTSSANLQCSNLCNGTIDTLVKYTFTATGEDTCHSLCTQDFARQNSPNCASATSVNPVCVNAD
jgi:hypothetical protein